MRDRIINVSDQDRAGYGDAETQPGARTRWRSLAGRPKPLLPRCRRRRPGRSARPRRRSPGRDPEPRTRCSRRPRPGRSPTMPREEPSVDLAKRRDELTARFAELQCDLGGLVYEMAIRDHIRVDVLVRRAAILQDVDAELGEVERILRMEQTGAAGACASCQRPTAVAPSTAGSAVSRCSSTSRATQSALSAPARRARAHRNADSSSEAAGHVVAGSTDRPAG